VHTTRVDDVSFVHNGDYSGEVRIVASPPEGGEKVAVEVPSMGVLLNFALRPLREELSEIVGDSATPEQLFEIAKILKITLSQDGRPIRSKKI
jgi:hypothetical protein